MAQLINNAEVSAMLDTLALEANSSVTVNLSELWVEKTASTTNWTGGNLGYTILIENRQDAGGTPLTSLSFTDLIDPTIATLVTGSLAVNGVVLTPAQYTYVSGVLTIPLADLNAGASHTITFQVQRV